MKYCVKRGCGEELEHGAKFCSRCGFPQTKTRISSDAGKLKPEKSQGVEAKKKSGTSAPAAKKPAPEKPVPEKSAVKASSEKPTAKKKTLTYQEKRQKIYEMTSRDNCGECGCINCMQFAMQAASDKNPMDISDCPYIDGEDGASSKTLRKRGRASRSSKPQ